MPLALVIDDEPTIRSTLVRFLAREGWAVTPCASADEAVALLDAPAPPTPDLLLCDARLPGRSAADFLDWLAAHRPALVDRLVVMTGDPFSAAVPVRGATPPPVLHKPFEFDQLRDLLKGRGAPGAG
jgi:CheY-like chemotaxis protein